MKIILYKDPTIENYIHIDIKEKRKRKIIGTLDIKNNVFLIRNIELHAKYKNEIHSAINKI